MKYKRKIHIKNTPFHNDDLGYNKNFDPIVSDHDYVGRYVGLYFFCEKEQIPFTGLVINTDSEGRITLEIPFYLGEVTGKVKEWDNEIPVLEAEFKGGYLNGELKEWANRFMITHEYYEKGRVIRNFM